MLRNSLADLAISFGEVLLPLVLAAVGAAREWLDTASEWSKLAMGTAVVIAALAAALGPLILAIGVTFRSLGTLMKFLAGVNVGLHSTSVAAALATRSLLAFARVGLGAISAFFIGWQIGAWARQKFQEVRLAGIAMVRGLLILGAELEGKFKLIWLSIKSYFGMAMDGVLELAAAAFRKLGDLAGKIPIDAAQKRYYYLAVPKNAEHPNAAKLFTVFAMTPEAQALWWQYTQQDLHLFPKSHLGQIVDSYQQNGVQFFETTIAWWKNHPEIAATTQEMVKILRAAKN